MSEKEIKDSISDYLRGGGLFNPEMMEHDKVRNLLIEARDLLEKIGNQKAIGVILFDPDREGEEWSVEMTDLGRGCFATLTDFELKVCAVEIGLIVQRAVEMPPSPRAGEG